MSVLLTKFLGGDILEQLKIRIFPDGQIQAETSGIKGKACTDYVKVLEKLLIAKVVESTYTEEYYQIWSQEVSENTLKQYDK